MIKLEQEQHCDQQLRQQQDDIDVDERLSTHSLYKFVNQVMQDTLYNKSSMLQDIHNNRQTEISHLNGYIVKKGRELNIDVHSNEDIVHRINEIEIETKKRKASATLTK